jgi:hypothetical protein
MAVSSWCSLVLQNYVAKPLIVCILLIYIENTCWLKADQFNVGAIILASKASATILSTKLSTAFVDKPESHAMTDA